MGDNKFVNEYTAGAGNNNTEANEGEAIELNNYDDQSASKTEMSSSNKNFLYVATCTANLAALTCGIAFGWTSPVLPKLTTTDITNPLLEPATEDQTSWIGSLLPVGAALGPFAAGAAADKVGRKITLLLSCVPFAIAFLCSAYANKVLLFYLARFLCGFGTGGIFTVLPMYIGEIAEDSVRGALSSLMNLFITVGLLFSYSVGPYLDVKTFNLMCVVVPAAFLILFYAFIPESPYYLVAASNETEAEKALMKIRSKTSSEVKQELESVKTCIAESKASKAKFVDIFKSKGSKKALILSVGLVALQQFSGINVILFYTQTIFKATGSTIPADISTVIIGVVQVVFSCVTPILVDNKGKRFLLLASAAGMALSHFALGYYFRQKDGGKDVQSLFWLPVLCLMTYNATYCIGFGPLPWAIMGELFPANIKSAASTVTAAGCWALSFFITKYFATLAKYVGNGFCFWIFGGFCAFAGCFVYKWLPETSGKSLQEIQDILEGTEKKHGTEGPQNRKVSEPINKKSEKDMQKLQGTHVVDVEEKK